MRHWPQSHLIPRGRKKQMWRKTRPSTPKATRAPDLTINLGWPDSSGFTQCSNDYYSICMSLETSNPSSFSSPTPEDYEQYAALLRERNRLIAEGHTGKSFRIVKLPPCRRRHTTKFVSLRGTSSPSGNTTRSLNSPRRTQLAAPGAPDGVLGDDLAASEDSQDGTNNRLEGSRP
jgi:hypothetical protein